MRSWVITKGSSSLEGMRIVEAATPEPAPGEVLIRVRACSLNYRDQAIVTGNYFGGMVQSDQVPLSDGAGTVEAVGAGVTRFAVGDRVAGLFFQNWHDGLPNANAGPALGATGAKGMLTEYVTLPERGVTRIAESLTFEEASTLPCAGVTAWNALMEGPRPTRPGRPCWYSAPRRLAARATDRKARAPPLSRHRPQTRRLERVKALGATHGINYKSVAAWGAEAARLSASGGIDHVVEVGGVGTLAQSIQSIGFAGEVALIGVLTREGDTNPHGLMMKGATLRGIFVGNGIMAERLNACIDAAGIKPVVDKVFAFEDAVEAYKYQASGALFGKTVIRI